MEKKYFYYIATISLLSNHILSEGVDIPSAHTLKKLLHKTCYDRQCLIQTADERTRYYPIIMDCHNKIKDLESSTAQSTEKKQFFYEDGQDEEKCTTTKCQIMRIKHKLHTYTKKLAALLKPYNAELRIINEKIYTLRHQLETLYGIKDDDFYLPENMLFL